MSTTSEIPEDRQGESEALDYVAEHYDAHVDLAESDLPIAEDCQRILDWYHEERGGPPHA